MKVAIITNYWKDSDGGGIKTYLVNLVKVLNKKGVEAHVLFREGVDPYQVFCGKNKIVFLMASYRHLNKYRPDVIHTHGTWYCLLPGVLYKKLRGCTLVHTFHTEPTNKLSIPGKYFFQCLLNVCDTVSFVSNGLQKSINDVYGLSFTKTAITYGGVEVREVTHSEVQKFCSSFILKPNYPILLVQAFTANALKAQGLKIVIQALEILKKTYPDIILLVTREGRFVDEMKTHSDNMGVRDRIIFTGDVQNPFVPIIICDVFIFPWLGKSGVGLALLEAMSCCKSVIAFDAGYGSEVVIDGFNGLLVIPDAIQVAEKIDFLLKNGDYADRLGNNAKITTQNKFTWDLSAEKFLKLYANQHQ